MEAFLAWRARQPAALPALRYLDEETRQERATEHLPDAICTILRVLEEDGLATLADGWFGVQEPPVGEAFCLQARRFADQTWEWVEHVYRQLAGTPVSLAVSKGARHVLGLAWYLFTQATLLLHVAVSCRADDGSFGRAPTALLGTASAKYAIVRLMRTADRIDMDADPGQPLVDYPVSSWRDALATFLNVRHATVGFTPSSSAYLSALLLRYALLVQQDGGEQQPGDDVYDDPAHCHGTPQPNDDEEVADPLERYSRPWLRASFLLDYAVQLIPVIRHNRAAGRWWRDAGMPGVLQGAEITGARQRAIAGWSAFVRDVSRHPRTRESVHNLVRARLLGRLLRPGEMLMRAWELNEPLRNIEPVEVLHHYRLQAYAVGKDMMAADNVFDLLVAWTAAVSGCAGPREAGGVPPGGAVADTWEETAAARPDYEHVALLLFEVCLDVWWESRGCQEQWSFAGQAYVDNASVHPPYDAPPANRADALRVFQGQTPIFVAIDHLYAVVSRPTAAAGGEPETEATGQLVEALTLWLSAVAHERPGVPIHPMLAPLL